MNLGRGIPGNLRDDNVQGPQLYVNRVADVEAILRMVLAA
jgi:hypothetical protein